MKTEKIEELFDKHAIFDDYRCNYIMCLDEFFDAINQAELEWYKKLDNKLDGIAISLDTIGEFWDYRNEIKDKIKELGNDN